MNTLLLINKFTSVNFSASKLKLKIPEVYHL